MEEKELHLRMHLKPALGHLKVELAQALRKPRRRGKHAANEKHGVAKCSDYA
jgi:predicted metal-dependent peptidase